MADTKQPPRHLGQAWVGLTSRERGALLVLALLFALGLGARYWHARQRASTASPPPASAAERSDTPR